MKLRHYIVLSLAIMLGSCVTAYKQQRGAEVINHSVSDKNLLDTLQIMIDEIESNKPKQTHE